MIFGNIEDKAVYEFLPENLKQCFDYFSKHDMAALDKGSYPIDGKNFFVNIENYTTVQRADRFWEAHRKYIDVHMMIDGTETIDTAFLSHMKVISYDEAHDFAKAEGTADASVKLTRKGDFLICWPQDVHRTATICDAPCKLKKAIFKVKL